MSQSKAEALSLLNSNNSSLKSLRLENGCTDSDIKALRVALQNNNYLTALYLEFNQIGDEGAEVLASTTKLLTLHLTGNNIGNVGAKFLANNSNLTDLDVCKNKIGDEGVSAFAMNASLTSLEVSENEFGKQGVQVLAQNTTLKTLSLIHNQIDDEGAKALANNFNITTLYLQGNMITDEGAKAFFDNNSLTALYVSDNQITDAVRFELKGIVATNRQAKDLKFIEQVVELVKGSRQSQQKSNFRFVPNELLHIIFAFMAVNLGLERGTENVAQICQFIITTLRPGVPLNWHLANQTSGFFKKWNPEERKTVVSRFDVRKPSIESSSTVTVQQSNSFSASTKSP
jgi:hypothetical protein